MWTHLLKLRASYEHMKYVNAEIPHISFKGNKILAHKPVSKVEDEAPIRGALYLANSPLNWYLAYTSVELVVGFCILE